jgi:aspartokinase
MTKYADADGTTALCLCVESAFLDDVVELIDTSKVDLGIEEFTYRSQIRIISIYPHKERARVAERLFTTLEMNGIELLSANNASSVISCVLHSDSVDQALACLRQAFQLP